MKKNKFAAVGAGILAFTLTTCSSVSASADSQLNIETGKAQETKIFELILSSHEEEPTGIVAEQAYKAQIEAEKQESRRQLLEANSEKMDKAISKLKKHIGSQYGGGASPGYWDCSGLVTWFYEQQGIDLYHSASFQANAGKRVKTPKVGDIVAFHYGSAKWSFHVGIYIGDGKVLHAYNPYRDTVVQKVSDVADENGAWASYTRIVETN